MPRTRWTVCAGIALLATAIATAASPGDAAAGEILVAAAASLRESAVLIADTYEATRPGSRALLTFGASSALAAQIRAGAPVDVFLSADPRIVQQLVDLGLVADGDSFRFAGNRLVVIRASDRALEISGPRDLLRPEVRLIAISGRAVPVGRYARAWLESVGLDGAFEERVALTEHARASLAAVELGHADLAIVYATDALAARSAVVAYAIPDSEQPAIAYAAARIADSSHAEDAGAFLAHLRSDAVRAILSEAGFEAAASEGRAP
ncbi:MAG: molybdate ABC transporter substrate-binding protein [Proteobacteria bacterium]|nr:molybdate ABC transporter substrate-binding protein [Pseudomonadota bacterium]